MTSYEVSFIGRENLELTSATKLYGIIVWEGKVTQMIQNIVLFYNKHIRSGSPLALRFAFSQINWRDIFATGCKPDASEPILCVDRRPQLKPQLNYY